MSTISVQTHFAAGHRILGLLGEGAKCRNIHGHTFTVKWTIEQDISTEDPVEFGELKKRLKNMVKQTYDHQFLLDKTDDFLHYLNINHLRCRVLDGPPTTERIAEDIAKLTMQHFTEEVNADFQKYAPLAPHAKLLSVELGEGPENTATWENPLYVQYFARGGAVGQVRPGGPLPYLGGGLATSSGVHPGGSGSGS